MLGAAAWITGSTALRSQVAASVAEIAVQVFVLIGVLSSARPSDTEHPLGYGSERFFWSFLAALGIFIGGGCLAVDEAVRAALHPSLPDHYTVAYAVLAATFVLDALALETQLRPLRQQAARQNTPLRAVLGHSTDPAATTVVVGGTCGLVGGVLAAAGLAVTQATHSAAADTAASMLIGVLLLAASAWLLQTNRELLSGRGVPPSMLRNMRAVITAQRGVLDVPDLFAVLVGPSSLIVNGDVTFDDDLDVPAVEDAIMRSADALRTRWVAVDFVYLTPVARARRTRGAHRLRAADRVGNVGGAARGPSG